MSEGEAAHLGWVMAHPARAGRRVRAARGFISPRLLDSVSVSAWDRQVLLLSSSDVLS